MSEKPPKENKEVTESERVEVNNYFDNLRKMDDHELEVEAGVLYESELKAFKEFLKDKCRGVFTDDAIDRYLEVEGRSVEFIDDYETLVSIFENLGIVEDDPYNKDIETWFDGNSEILYEILLEAVVDKRKSKTTNIIKGLYLRLTALQLRVEVAYRYSRGNKEALEDVRNKCIAFFVYVFKQNGYKIPPEFTYLITSKVEEKIKEVTADQDRIANEILDLTRSQARDLEKEIDEHTMSADSRFAEKFAQNRRNEELEKIDELENRTDESSYKFIEGVLKFLRDESDPRRMIDIVIGEPFVRLVADSRKDLGFNQ